MLFMIAAVLTPMVIDNLVLFDPEVPSTVKTNKLHFGILPSTIKIDDLYFGIIAFICANSLSFSIFFLLVSAVDTIITVCILQDEPEKNSSLDQPKKVKITSV